MTTMVATTAPMPPALHDPTSREALARVREERRHGCATVRQHIIARHGERPKDLWLRMLLRVSEAGRE